jgi:hypothetical protein
VLSFIFIDFGSLFLVRIIAGIFLVNHFTF